MSLKKIFKVWLDSYAKRNAFKYEPIKLNCATLRRVGFVMLRAVVLTALFIGFLKAIGRFKAEPRDVADNNVSVKTPTPSNRSP